MNECMNEYSELASWRGVKRFLKDVRSMVCFE